MEDPIATSSAAARVATPSWVGAVAISCWVGRDPTLSSRVKAEMSSSAAPELILSSAVPKTTDYSAALVLTCFAGVRATMAFPVRGKSTCCKEWREPTALHGGAGRDLLLGGRDTDVCLSGPVVGVRRDCEAGHW
jgi:hypothetical protein